jgi:hypothetical protein
VFQGKSLSKGHQFSHISKMKVWEDDVKQNIHLLKKLHVDCNDIAHDDGDIGVEGLVGTSEW